MLYFAYGSNMLEHRLGKRIGKISKIDIGKLVGYRMHFNKLSKDGSSKANLVKTNTDADFVLGVIYEIQPAQKPELDKFEGVGKGYDSITVEVERLSNDEKITVDTYQASKTVDNQLPYEWYKKLVLEGAIQNKLPEEYIAAIGSVVSKNDDDERRTLEAELIINESKYDKKWISPTIDFINELNKSKQCIILLPGHAFNGKQIQITKAKEGFSFETQTDIIKGLQTHKELQVRANVLELSENGRQWFIEGKHFLVDSIDYDTENMFKILHGTINSVASINHSCFTNTYIRVLIPIEERLKIDRDYQCYPFVVDYKTQRGLLKVTISGKDFHFYDIRNNGKDYLVIDTTDKLSLREFQIACNSILLSYAFLSGSYLTGEAYYCTFDSESFDVPIGILYHQLSDPMYGLFGAYTTNPFIGQNTEAFKRNERREFDDPKLETYKSELNWFPADVFSKMCDFAFSNDKVLRTLILLISQHNTLEVKIPTQYIALETITAAFIKGNTELKPIEDTTLASELTKQLTDTLNAFAIKHKLEDQHKDRLLPMRRKIETLNAPPNADKLSKLFEQVGYTLSKEEQKIIGMRNKFLHGSTISVGLEEDDFKELFYLSLRLHFLLAVLLLKTSGFSGLIVNHAKLLEHITDKYLDEEVFRKI